MGGEGFPDGLGRVSSAIWFRLVLSYAIGVDFGDGSWGIRKIENSIFSIDFISKHILTSYQRSFPLRYSSLHQQPSISPIDKLPTDETVQKPKTHLDSKTEVFIKI